MTTRMADRSGAVRIDDVVPLPPAAMPDPTESTSPLPVREPVTERPHLTPGQQLSRTQFDAVAATVVRRRSLTDSLQMAFAAYWDTVVAGRDLHTAVRVRPAEVDPTSVDRTTAPDVVAAWLALIAQAHQIRWELPDEQVALLVAATLEGLTIDFLATGDPQSARPVLQVLAYQVGRYGRRPATTQQH